MKILIILLGILLIATNAFWYYTSIDAGVTLSYNEHQIHELEETRKQLMALLPEVSIHVSRQDIIEAASKHTDQQVFEKDGCTWVGWLGLKFDQNQRLVSVSPAWSFGEPDPCYPDNKK